MPTNCPTPPSDESFQLIILNQDWQDFGRVYDSEEALPLLMNADTSESLFVISLREIEHYDWDTQVITLTKDATGALVSVLDNAAQGEEAEAIMGLRESLGWGNELERALYIRVFLVRVDSDTVYGGIFLNAVSQMAIDYPVLRVTVVDGKAVFAVLPVHVPFTMVDPIGGAGGVSELSIAEEAEADVEQLNEQDDFLTAWILDIATSDTASQFRELIRDTRIKTVLEAAGKLGD